MTQTTTVKVATKKPDKTGWSGTVKPEWVDYHDEKHVCGTCEMREDANCTLLKKSVPEYGHCEAWTEK